MVLINKAKEQQPDLIVITGDVIDRRRYDLEIALSFCSELIKMAPVYYVSGNHEAWSGKYAVIISKIKDIGVNVIEDEIKIFKIGETSIDIIGIKENMEKRGGLSETSKKMLEQYKNDKLGISGISILLTHRPELFPIYQTYPLNLIFSGHAHGGQIKIPLIGAVFAPNQGLMPRYSGGKYEENKQTMFLSRGLGNSAFPFRVFNRPNLVLVELKSK